MKNTINRIESIRKFNPEKTLKSILTNSNDENIKIQDRLRTAINTDLPDDYQTGISKLAEKHIELLTIIEEKFGEDEKIDTDFMAEFIKETVKKQLPMTYDYYWNLHLPEIKTKKKKKPKKHFVTLQGWVNKK